MLGSLDEGQAHARGEAPLRQPHRPDNGHLHWNLLAQWEELKTGLRKAAGDARAATAARRSPRHRRRHLGRRFRPARPRRRGPRQPLPLPRRPHRRRDGTRLRAASRARRSSTPPAFSSCSSTRCSSCWPCTRAERAAARVPPRRCCSCRTCSTTCSPACARASSRSPRPARCTTRARSDVGDGAAGAAGPADDICCRRSCRPARSRPAARRRGRRVRRRAASR